MTHAVWPEDLPRPSRVGYQVAFGEGRLRRAGEGPPGYKRKFSRMPTGDSVTMTLGRSQYLIFKTFYDDTVKGGSLLFWMPDPMLDGTAALDAEDEPLLDANGQPVIVSRKTLCLFGEPPPQVVSSQSRMSVTFTLVRMPL